MTVFIVVLNVVIHLAVPALFVYLVAVPAVGDRLRWLGSLVVLVSFLALLQLAGGGWHWVGWWWPYLFWIAAAGAGFWFVLHYWTRLPWLPPRTFKPWVSVVISAVLTVFFALGVIGALEGQTPSEAPVELEFPLVDGLFYVGHGGSTDVVNHHVPVSAQWYAVDIVQLNRFGERARGLWPRRLDAYEIWGTEVVAPCDGEVVSLESTLDDLPVPETDEANPLGNHVAVYCDDIDVTVVLAHLQQGLASQPDNLGGIELAQQDRIKAGEPVGRVGNSGNTTEPHLHIHAVEGRVDQRRELISEGSGVPMEFDGRFLTRTDRIDRR